MVRLDISLTLNMTYKTKIIKAARSILLRAALLRFYARVIRYSPYTALFSSSFSSDSSEEATAELYCGESSL